MKPSTEQQKRFEARNKTLRNVFLLALNCFYRGECGDSDLFYDPISQHLIKIKKEEISKQALIDALNTLRSKC